MSLRGDELGEDSRVERAGVDGEVARERIDQVDEHDECQADDKRDRSGADRVKPVAAGSDKHCSEVLAADAEHVTFVDVTWSYRRPARMHSRRRRRRPLRRLHRSARWDQFGPLGCAAAHVADRVLPIRIRRHGANLALAPRPCPTRGSR
jgi:hypothetical protein